MLKPMTAWIGVSDFCWVPTSPKGSGGLSFSRAATGDIIALIRELRYATEAATTTHAAAVAETLVKIRGKIRG